MLTPLLVLSYPAIDPELVHIWGPIGIKWYGLAYAAGFFFGWWYFIKLSAGKDPIMKRAQVDDLAFWAMLGVIVGGRLGSVLFYNFKFYVAHPLQVFAIWEGGMSFHGGLIGVSAAVIWFCWRRDISLAQVADRVACVGPVGLFFGRLANFINQELWGRPTDVPWAMIFPHDETQQPRHPSQLYEAGLEGIVLFAILNLLFHFTRLRDKPGVLTGVFFACYGLFRTFVEFFREPDANLQHLFGGLTMGQYLSIPMVGIGLVVIYLSLWKASAKASP